MPEGHLEEHHRFTQFYIKDEKQAVFSLCFTEVENGRDRLFVVLHRVVTFCNR